MFSTRPEPAAPLRHWPADQVERWSIERLKTHASNPRLHSEADLGKIAASILKWGWTMPMLVDEQGELISGHARLRAAIILELKSIPVIVARGWSEDEKRAYRVADDQLAARASWDPERLRDELQALKFADFDLGLIGFEPDQLETILADSEASGLTDPDSVPEVPDQPVTRPGDGWLLGKHRVGCGNSTSAADVAPVLAGSQPHLMITDPPYGVEYDPSWRARRNQSGGKLARGKVLNDDRADWHEAYALFPGDVAYVWYGALHGDVVAADLAACGFAAPRPDRLGQAALHLEPRPLSLEARMLLVRRARGQDEPLARRPHADDSLGDRQQQSFRQPAARAELGAWHPEAGRMHAPPDRQQQPARPGDL